MKKAKQPFYWFYMLKTHTHMQISYKPVVQARPSKFLCTPQKEKK